MQRQAARSFSNRRAPTSAVTCGTRAGFPAPAEFTQYPRAVAAAIVPRIEGMTREYLSTVQAIRPWGEVPRIEALGHGLIGHGNGHLGRASYARTLFGLRGLPY